MREAKELQGQLSRMKDDLKFRHFGTLERVIQDVRNCNKALWRHSDPLPTRIKVFTDEKTGFQALAELERRESQEANPKSCRNIHSANQRCRPIESKVTTILQACCLSDDQAKELVNGFGRNLLKSNVLR